MTESDFDWMVSNHAVWGWKAPVKASVSGVSLLQLSPFFASIFPLFPRNAWYSGYKADNKYVGHVPMGLSFLIFPIFIFLKLPKVPVKVAGSRRLENGLVVPGSFLTRTTSRVMIRATKFEDSFEEFMHSHGHKKARKGKGRGSPFPSLHNLLSLFLPQPPPFRREAFHGGWRRFA